MEKNKATLALYNFDKALEEALNEIYGKIDIIDWRELDQSVKELRLTIQSMILTEEALNR